MKICQYIRLHMKAICWRFYNKTPFIFWVCTREISEKNIINTYFLTTLNLNFSRTNWWWWTNEQCINLLAKLIVYFNIHNLNNYSWSLNYYTLSCVALKFSSSTLTHSAVISFFSKDRYISDISKFEFFLFSLFFVLLINSSESFICFLSLPNVSKLLTD